MESRFANRFLVIAAFLSLGAAGRADDIDFVTQIKPILAAHCVECHGPTTRESGLRLDLAGGIFLGGNGGGIVEPGAPEKSRLIAILNGSDAEIERMPPDKEPLSPNEIALISRWIRDGADAPASELKLTVESDHWSFKIPTRPRLPRVSDTSWPLSPIDRFILHRLEENQLSQSPAASRETLIKRVTLDLLGVLPTPAEVETFVNDARPDAYDQLVDRLLASPAYGERWGRHWLDLARYADSNGFTRDFARDIWKYREWVIRAVNANLPFDQFTIEQFAGDLLPDATLDQRIATGFHRNTLINEEGGTDQEQFRVDAVADRVSTTGVVYLGLTLGCARCHEHKYDPISQREYYQMFAFLNNCDEPSIEAPTQLQIAHGQLSRRKEIRDRIEAKRQRLEDQKEAILVAQLRWEETITPEQLAKHPGNVQEALLAKPNRRTDEQRALVDQLFRSTDVAQGEFELLKQIADLRASEPLVPTTLVLQARPEPRPTHIHRRGNFLEKGDRVVAAVPQALNPMQPSEKPDRLALAEWLVDSQQPLTPRVVMNRYWQRFFGRGIVATENDFGTQGSLPTHPQLLDWLAVRFIESGWDVKQMHRLIVTSATYRQSSKHRPELNDVDPQNELWGRQTRLRLEAEIIRDAALSAGGLLCRTIGGPSVFPPQPDGVFDFTQDPKPWNTATGGDRYRRGMYTHFWRSSPYPALSVFDAPSANVTCTRRVRSNTPLQSLILANDVQFMECAKSLATEIVDSSLGDEVQQVAFAFRRCLARNPRDDESRRLLSFVAAQRKAFAAQPQLTAALVGKPSVATSRDLQLAAWTAAARVLLNLDEFITRE